MGLSWQQQELRVKTLLLVAARSSGDSGSGTPVTPRRSEPTGQLGSTRLGSPGASWNPGSFPLRRGQYQPPNCAAHVPRQATRFR
ncbi:unnamed protein product [Rangifer tarandus platyrhynchus]|uniref:Uncharacterized protein n=1 Tax=Rangifer tarandus platyrhynchus TaxID=3082113 RepID=A0AC59YHE5_RANTA